VKFNGITIALVPGFSIILLYSQKMSLLNIFHAKFQGQTRKSSLSENRSVNNVGFYSPKLNLSTSAVGIYKPRRFPGVIFKISHFNPLDTQSRNTYSNKFSQFAGLFD